MHIIRDLENIQKYKEKNIPYHQREPLIYFILLLSSLLLFIKGFPTLYYKVSSFYITEKKNNRYF